MIKQNFLSIKIPGNPIGAIINGAKKLFKDVKHSVQATINNLEDLAHGAQQALDTIIDPANAAKNMAINCLKSAVSILTKVPIKTLEIANQTVQKHWYLSLLNKFHALGIIIAIFIFFLLIGSLASGGNNPMKYRIAKHGLFRFLIMMTVGFTVVEVLPIYLMSLATDANKHLYNSDSLANNTLLTSFLNDIKNSPNEVYNALLGFLGVLIFSGIIIIAGWGIYIQLLAYSFAYVLIAPLLVICAALWIYPPWSDKLKKCASLLFSILITPSIIYYTFFILFHYLVKPDGDKFQEATEILMAFLLTVMVPYIVTKLLQYFALPTPTQDFAYAAQEGANKYVNAFQTVADGISSHHKPLPDLPDLGSYKPKPPKPSSPNPTPTIPETPPTPPLPPDNKPNNPIPKAPVPPHLPKGGNEVPELEGELEKEAGKVGRSMSGVGKSAAEMIEQDFEEVNKRIPLMEKYGLEWEKHLGEIENSTAEVVEGTVESAGKVAKPLGEVIPEVPIVVSEPETDINKISGNNKKSIT